MSYIFTDVLLAIVGILASILIVLSIVGIGKYTCATIFLTLVSILYDMCILYHFRVVPCLEVLPLQI